MSGPPDLSTLLQNLSTGKVYLMSDELQRETHELVTRIDERLAGHCERFDAHVEQTGKRFAHLNRTVYGENGSAGLKSEVAVLKDQSERRKWIVPALISALLSLVAALGVLLVS